MLSFISNAQSSQIPDLYFTHYTPENGLSSSVVNCIIQDKTGYLWFGTYSGLDRFDGINFKSYKHIPGNNSSIINGFVKCLFEDSESNIWIGTTNGLDKLIRNTDKFIHYKLPELSNKHSINDIKSDSNGFIWIGTSNGLYKFNPVDSTVTRLAHDKSNIFSLINNNISSILIDRFNRIWIGTISGFDMFDTGSGRFIHFWFNKNPEAASYQVGKIDKYSVTTLCEDKTGIIWIGTQDGLLEFDPENNLFNLYQSDPNISSTLSFHSVSSICQANENEIWIGTRVGLNLFNKKSRMFTRIFHDDKNINGLSQNAISALLIERSGTFWVTTSGGGINRADNPLFSFRRYNNKPWRETTRFASASILCMDVSSDNSLWLGTPTGLMNFDPVHERYRVFDYKNNIRAIKEDKKGNLWIGVNISSGRGLVKLNNAKDEISVTDSAGNKLNFLINDFIFYDDSCLLACTSDSGRILKINTNLNKYSTIYESEDHLFTIYKDKSNLIWIGTRNNGLLCFNPKINKITDHFIYDPQNPKSISGNSVMSILEDHQNNLWLGTNIGLNKYDRVKKEFMHFTEKDGIPDNRVDLIFKDSHKNLWIISIEGLSKFNIETGKLRNYDVMPGFIPPDAISVGCQSQTGEIYFDTPDGITRFHPDSVLDNPFIPPVVITNIKVSGRSIGFSEKITLSHSENNVSFEFAALSYIRPEKNSYSFKLEGLEKDWSQSGTSRSASYRNLNPGKYLFRVKGSNNDGRWNENDASIAVIILPPWYQTSLAYIFYSVFLIGLLFYFWRMQLKRIKIKHEFEMSIFEAQKLKELDELKNRFFTNISHEFRTPLTMIIGPVKQTIEKLKESKIKDDLTVVLRNANNLLVLVNQLLDISRLESGNMKLLTSPQNIVTLLKSRVFSFLSYAERKNIKLNFNSSADIMIVYIDKDKIEKIMNNLIANSIKFTPEGGIVEVLAENKENNLIITIRDNGMGIPENKISRIFDRFYQVDGSHTREQEGTGIGLSLTKELVELHKGNIEVQSQEGKGTMVTVTIPLCREHLTDEEVVEDISTEKDEVEQLDSTFKIQVDQNLNQANNKDIDIIGKNYLPLLMVVEDNSDVRQYIKNNLDNDYRVIEAFDGDSAWQQAIENMPDLIVSDVMMPGMDGFKLCEKLKNNEVTSHIPVILLTAKATINDKLEGYETGADDYLLKPFELNELQARIKNLLEQRRRLQLYFQKRGMINLEDSGVTSIDKVFLKKVFELVLENISESGFTVELLADKLAVSRSFLNKKIVALTGEPPRDFIRRIRLLKAAELIEKKSGNISEIALEVGFCNPAYFSECFKNQFGVAPSRYYKKIINN